MLSYSFRDLFRNPRRTLAAVAGVTLAVGLFSGITFFVDSSAAAMTERAISPVSIDMQALLTAPTAPPPSLQASALQSQVAALKGVASADVLGSADLPAGSLSPVGAPALNAPVRIFGFDQAYLDHFPIVRVDSGGLTSAGVLLSQEAAAALNVAPGGRIQLNLGPGKQPLLLTVSGIADFSKADALFASRSPDTQGDFVRVPNVVVVSPQLFQTSIVPAATTTPAALEVDVKLDRSRLNGDPATALTVTQGIKRLIERTAPGQVTVIDNLSDALSSARADAVLAKVLFLFLGLPGVLLAAYLSRYAGDLLAQAQRREQATLRARGAQPKHLLRVLTITTIAVGAIGSLLGLLLGFAALFALFGTTPASADQTGLALSILISLGAGILITWLALYLPSRRSLTREVSGERRELTEESGPPAWLRLRLDLAFMALAAVVGLVTYLSGGFKATAAEGATVSLSFYTLLAPLLAWIGATLFAVRLLLGAAGRLPGRSGASFGGLTGGTLSRSVRRRAQALAAGVVAISLAVAFGTSLAVFIGTYQAEKLSDARFTTGSDLRITPSALSPQGVPFASTLKVAGVDAVSAVQTATAVVGTDKRQLVAIDANSFQQVATLPDSFFLDGTASATLAKLKSDPTALLISDELSKTFNVQPGDSVKLQLTDNKGKLVQASFHVAGRFKQFPGFAQGTDLVGNLGYYQSVTGTTAVSFYLLKSANPDAAAAAIKSGPGKAVPVLIQSTTTAVNRDQSTLAALNLRGLDRLEALYTGLLSTAGIAIFVFGLLLQRRKEYVTMRALGIRGRQLFALVAGEAALVTAFSLVIGGVVGLAMAWMFVKILQPIFTLPPEALTIPTSRLSLLAGSVLAGMALAVLLASRSLKRLNPVELLREE